MHLLAVHSRRERAVLPPQEGTVLTPCSGTVLRLFERAVLISRWEETVLPPWRTMLQPQGTVLPLWGTVLPPQEHCCHYTGNNASTTRNCATTTENRAATRGTVLLPGEQGCPHSVKCCYQGNSADTMPSLPPQETLSYQHTSFKLQK